MLKKLRSSFSKSTTTNTGGSTSSLLTSAPTPRSSAPPTPTSSVSISKQLNRARSLYKEGKESYDEGNYKNSFQCLQEAVQIQEVSLGKYHKETIQSYWHLGRAACKCTDGNEDNDEQQQQPMVVEEGGGGDDLQKQKQKRHVVLQAFQRAVRMAEGAYSDEEYAVMLQDMKDCYQEAFMQDVSTSSTSGGGSVSGGSDCQESVSSNISHRSNDDPFFRKVQNDPMKYMSKALELERKGDSYVKKKNYRKASNIYSQALQIQDACVGEDSLDGADIRSKLALCFLNIGSLQQARRALQMAYTCFVAQVGTDHPATLGAVARMKKIAMSTPSTKSIMSTTSVSSSVSGGAL